MSKETINPLDRNRSPWAMAMRRFLKNRRAVIALGAVVLVGLATVLVPLISPRTYDRIYKGMDYEGPSATHAFGNDGHGRDLMVRTFRGGRISFAVGILATAVAVTIGVFYGAVAGFLGGKIDMVMMRFVDVMYGLPYMLIVIIAMTIFQSRSFVLVFVVLGAFGWLTMARIVRGQVLSLKEREFVEAARSLGAGTFWIIRKHMIPNLLGPVIVYTTLTIPSVMLQEAFLSFLGLGISEPETSWGVLIADGARGMSTEGIYWWLIAFPGMLFTLTLFGLNAAGDGIRDAFDVQQV